MADTFQSLASESLNSTAEQDRYYQEAFAAGDGTIPYNTAVEIAARRLRLAMGESVKKTSGSNIYLGLLELDRHPPAEAYWNDQEVKILVVEAKTSYWVWLALRALAAITPDTTKLPSLAKWRSEFLADLLEQPRKPSGVSPYRFAYRDALIVREVSRLEQFGFPPSRAKASDQKTSGCDVVSDALIQMHEGIGHSAIESIWNKRHEYKTPALMLEALQAVLNNRH